MAYIDHKITNADLVGKGNVGKPDTPNLSTSDMQRVLDEIPRDVIIPKYNSLVDELTELDNKISSDDITNMQLDAEGKIQISTDGGTTYKYGGSTGHTLVDSSGTAFPARGKMQFSDNVTLTDNEAGNRTIVTVKPGEKGAKGDTATVAIGTVREGDRASVINVGSSNDAIFNFTLPKGDAGNAATVQVGTVESGEVASVSNRGTSENAILDFVLPKGDKGDMGRGLTILGTYDTLAELQSAHPVGLIGNAYMVGTTNPKSVYIWNEDTLSWVDEGTLQGAKGDKGDSATVTIGTVTEGEAVSVENVGTSTDAIFNFVLKKGDKGDKGDTGDSATIAIGNVEKGDTASIMNVGTPNNAIFDFVLPKGDKGDRGEPTTVNGKSGNNVTIFATDIQMSSTDDTKVSDQLSTKADTNSICNPNLLDNGWFTVNQRGQTSYTITTSQIYTFDRWYLGWYGQIEKTTNGIKYSNSDSRNNSTLQQKFDNALLDGIYTVSILLTDGTIRTKSGQITSSASLRYTLNRLVINVTRNDIKLIAEPSAEYNIQAIKLEVGSISTIANDVAPNYAEELIRCQGSTADSSDTWANAPQKYSVNSTKTNLTFHANVDSGRSICVVERQGNLVHISAHLTLSSAINFTSNVAIINGLPKPRTVLYPYAVSRDGTVGRLYFVTNGTLQTFWGGGTTPTGDGAIMIDFTYIAQ